MNPFLWMLVQWTPKMCPFHISRNSFWWQVHFKLWNNNGFLNKFALNYAEFTYLKSCTSLHLLFLPAQQLLDSSVRYSHNCTGRFAAHKAQETSMNAWVKHSHLQDEGPMAGKYLCDSMKEGLSSIFNGCNSKNKQTNKGGHPPTPIRCAYDFLFDNIVYWRRYLPWSVQYNIRRDIFEKWLLNWYKLAVKLLIITINTLI